MVYPQPDGSELKVHEIDRTFDDGIYVEFDIRIRGQDDPDALLGELTKIASALR